MLKYVHLIEGRLAELPSEIKDSLDPKKIAKLLGESLRQHFAQSGVSATVAGLQATATEMCSAQQQLAGALRELTDKHHGVAAQVGSANQYITYSLEQRTKALDSLMHEFSKRGVFPSGYVVGSGLMMQPWNAWTV